jgi:hypothetical protein
MFDIQVDEIKNLVKVILWKRSDLNESLHIHKIFKSSFNACYGSFGNQYVNDKIVCIEEKKEFIFKHRLISSSTQDSIELKNELKFAVQDSIKYAWILHGNYLNRYYVFCKI